MSRKPARPRHRTGQNETLFKKLSRRQQAVIADLLTGNTIRAVSQNQAIGRTTLHRWLAQPEFKAALQQARKTAFFEATDGAKAGAAAAVFKTLELLNDEDPAIRLRAAKEILDRAFQAIEHDDVDERMTRIEDALGIRQPHVVLKDIIEPEGKKPS